LRGPTSNGRKRKGRKGKDWKRKRINRYKREGKGRERKEGKGEGEVTGKVKERKRECVQQEFSIILGSTTCDAV